MELVITRGYPASGKTTWARKWVAEDSENRARVNRDDLRASLFGGAGVLDFALENRVSLAQRSQVEAFLRAGVSVVVDDTNLRLKFARAWADLAVTLGAEFSVIDFATTADECVARDVEREAAGGRAVGEPAIRGMAAKFPLGRWPAVEPSKLDPVEARRYEGTPGGERTWIVDIDGTLANHNGRSPYDTSKYHEDLPFPVVRDLVGTIARSGQLVVVTSGRDDDFRDVTTAWLREHDVAYDFLFMRPAGDRRPDHVVKAELFWEHIAPKFDVQGCIDDRDRVVAMWRSMGLTCLQVAEGDF